MSERECHPECDIGPQADHPGYLGYRCIDKRGTTLPFDDTDDLTDGTGGAHEQT